MKFRLFVLTLILAVTAVSNACAAEVRIAVASNFRLAMTSLIEEFEINSDDKVVASYGSTGKHYAQIINGAPYDLFFAADAARPKLLEQEGLIVKKSRYTYAIGKLALWRPHSSGSNLTADDLLNDDIRYVALANPKLAPYGKAAEQVIEALAIGDRLTGKLVIGENIAQAFQFIHSGNAQLGFVAYSQLLATNNTSDASFLLIAQNLYDPIQQQAVLLNQTKVSKAFYTFIKSASGRNIIRQAGYQVID